MVDVRNYDFNIITDKTVKAEESFINLYVDECLKSEIKISATRRICRISDAKYKKVDLNKVMTEQYQHINTEECTILLSLLSKFEDMFEGALGTWNNTPV